MRQWEWRSVWGSGWTCVRHTNVVVVQWLTLEASIALFARRHPARQSDTILWMTWLLVAFQQLAFPSSRNLQAYLVPTGNVPIDFPSFLAKRQGALLGRDSHLSVSRLKHFSCCSWCRGVSRTRCIPQRIEIRGVRWSLCVCSHCLRELGSTKRFSSPAPFGPWPKIDWHFRRKPRNQLPVSEMLILVQRFNAVLLHDSLPDCVCSDY